MYRGRPVSLILRYASRLVGAARPNRFSGNEIISAVDAIKAAPAGYGRLRKRIHLFKHMAPIAPLVPTGAEIIVALNTELIYLGAIYAEAGMLSKAAAALDRATHYDKRFLQLTKAAATFSDAFASRYRADLEALSFLEQHEGSFAKLIRENKGSICVVGNSPCEIGRRLGRAIDDHALVVRFNNFSTSPEHAQDYGVKCDVWCRSPFYKDITRRPGFKPSLTITGSPIPWRKEDGQDMAIEYMARNEPLDSAPISLVPLVAIRCGAPPSSGILTIAWIKSILGSLDGVSVCGFELTDQKDGLKHYFNNPGRTKSPPHNWTGRASGLGPDAHKPP